MAGQSTSTRFGELFESALQAYEKKSGVTLAEHPLAVQIQSCESIESITTILQGQAKAFSETRGSDRIMTSIKNTVSILTRLSATASLAFGIGLSFAPVKAIHAGLAILLAAAKGVVDSYDALVDLLESIEHFLCRLNIYTQIPPSPGMDEMMVKIIVELISTLAVATKELKQGRTIKFVKKVFGEKDIEAVLHRLDRLTHDEAQATAAQTLEVIHGLVQGMRLVIDGIHDGKVSLGSVRESLEILHQVAGDVHMLKRDKLQQDIHRWLSPPDPWKNHNIARESHYEGTAAWFIHSNTFSEWKSSGPKCLLWIHGKPGAGKSVLCSTIIEEIDTMRKSGLASLAMFYFDFREDQKKDRRGLLSSMLVQLCLQSDSYYDILAKFYLEHASGTRQPSDDELVRCLKSIVQLPRQAPIFLIVDALDECTNTSSLSSPREKVLMLLDDLIESQHPNLHICVTSRTETDITVVLESRSFCSLSLHDESGQKADIKNYIEWVISTNRNMQRWKPEHKQLVVDVLTERADGMFRWVFCQLNYLGKCLPGCIQRALDELPDTLDVTYERTLAEINDANWQFAQRLFLCVAVASRPLLVGELAEFLAFDFSMGPIPKFREDWRLEDPLEAVLSTCSTLLAVVNVKNSHVVQFAHFSVKEYLTSDRFVEKHDTISRRYHVSMITAHTVVAQACLGILLHINNNITRKYLSKFLLAEYAAQHWFEHARFECVSEYAEEGMKQLFDANKPHFAVWLWIFDPIHGPTLVERPLLPRGTPLHYAAFCGLHTIVKSLTAHRPQHSKHVHSRTLDDTNSTPLHLASRKGHLAVARVLVKHGADVTARDGDGKTPLHLASRYGCFDLVRSFVQNGADVRTRDKYGSTPLHGASIGGHLDVARFLIEHGADAIARNRDGETSLHEMSDNGNLDLARFLVEHGADVMARNKHGGTPLHRASHRGYLDLVRFLIEHGADATARTKDGKTPMYEASNSWQENVNLAHLLVEHGADTTARNKNGDTPLHRASCNGYLDLARFLVKHGADATARNEFGLTPLHEASYFGHFELAQFLLEQGADVMTQTKFGSTPLHQLSYNGHLNLARLLVEHGAVVTARNMHGDTPLRRASRGGHLDLARFLIEHGADVTAQIKDGRTPLHDASGFGHFDLARFLVECGADATARNKGEETPLHGASCSGHLDLARFLVEHGADVKDQDKKMTTPLHHASFIGCLDLAQFLIEHGADSTARNKYWETPLHRASQSHRQNMDLAQLLVDSGANVTARTKDGETPLHRASYSGHFDLAWLLVNHGADTTARSKNGETPLHHASRHGYLDLARFLVEHGADVRTKNKDGETPLHRASFSGYSDHARFLIDHGADPRAQDKDEETPLHWASLKSYVDLVWFLVEQGADPRAQNKHKETPLHLAAVNGHLDLAQFLVKHGADPTVQDKNGETPLYRVSLNGYVDLAQFHVEHGADATSKNKDGETPLHRASQNGHLDLARFLIKHGADATARDKRGSTPLHQASREGHVDLAWFLVEHGAVVTALDKHGTTPLHWASLNGHLDLAQFLVERDAIAATKDKHGSTSLHRASVNGHVDLACFLLDQGANVAARNKHGSTPLHLASVIGHIDLARFLVGHGADVTAQDKNGSTPLHLVSRKGDMDLAEFLIEQGAVLTVRDKDGSTPLDRASRNGHEDFARFLTQQGANTAASMI